MSTKVHIEYRHVMWSPRVDDVDRGLGSSNSTGSCLYEKRIVQVQSSQCSVCNPSFRVLIQNNEVPCPTRSNGNLRHKIETLRRVYELVRANTGKSLAGIVLEAPYESEVDLRHFVGDLEDYGIVHVDHDVDGRRRPLHVATFDLDTVRWVTIETIRFEDWREKDPLGHNNLEEMG